MKLEMGLRPAFSGDPVVGPAYLPDLTLWHEWHARLGTLPEKWRDASLAEIARSLGAPAWCPVRPWRQETPGVMKRVTENANERVTQYDTPAGSLATRWTMGPDGDWWQTEYLVKSEADLPAALELANARSYVVDASPLPAAATAVGDEGIAPLELPRRPFSDLLHDFLGWGDGLMLLSHPVVREIIDVLECKLQELIETLMPLPESIILSPDNLDGQFISPRAFQVHLSPSYRVTSEIVHRHRKRLVVHIGGPASRIVQHLVDAGVDGLAGIAGPPQGDLTLAQARERANPDTLLWGGIPQDLLLCAYDLAAFRDGVVQSIHQARVDHHTVLGVADRVPVNAEIARLEALPILIEEAWNG